MKKNKVNDKANRKVKNCHNNKNVTSKVNDKQIGFEDKSFKLDEDNEHSFEVRDCK